MAKQIRFLDGGGMVLKSDEGIFYHKVCVESLPLLLGREEGKRLFAEGKEFQNAEKKCIQPFLLAGITVTLDDEFPFYMMKFPKKGDE